MDLGSSCVKTIVIDRAGEIVRRDLRPTGWSSVDTAQAVRESLPEAENEDARLVATGYGRVAVPFADRTVTEISCHARGAVKLFGEKDLNVIDIGGQDTKLIAVRNGLVAEFVMNDKCSAGTGRFLEVMANTLSVTPAGLCEMAQRGEETKISSLCTVFAESEVISLVGRGESRENIAYAVVDSIADKVAAQSSRLVSAGETVYLTGGLCECAYLREALAGKLLRPVVTRPDARYAGAIGAALSAAIFHSGN